MKKYLYLLLVLAAFGTLTVIYPNWVADVFITCTNVLTWAFALVMT